MLQYFASNSILMYNKPTNVYITNRQLFPHPFLTFGPEPVQNDYPFYVGSIYRSCLLSKKLKYSGFFYIFSFLLPLYRHFTSTVATPSGEVATKGYLELITSPHLSTVNVLFFQELLSHTSHHAALG